MGLGGPLIVSVDDGDGDLVDVTWSIDGENVETVYRLTQSDVALVFPAQFDYTPGVYTIDVSVTDNRSDPVSCSTILVLYDPNGGFVTGGGWIDSPGGAYKPEPSLTGRANFGFVSKYKKGATVPTGETEFKFKVAGLNFHSSTYQWLVIAGHRAQYKGEGTINGEGNYGFMLTAIDEKLTPSTDVDLFRIKIWDKDSGNGVVYDNQLGADDNGDSAAAIGGGSIVIHKAKK